MSTLLFDLESDGFLRQMTRIHCLVMRDAATRETWVYRHNDEMNNIAEGVERLMGATVLVGHNIVSFDIKAIQKLYPWFQPKAKLQDTLVLGRVAAPDLKNHDMALFKKGILPGELIGNHKLETWGIRLGVSKGDYSNMMKSKGLDPWAAWNQEMEDYCVNDVDVTEALWAAIQTQHLAENCNELEHNIHAVCARMEEHGFPFDIASAKALAEKLEAEIVELRERCVATYGSRFRPERKKQIAPYWYDPDGVNETKERKGLFATPSLNPDHGEDMSRRWWGDITEPKKPYKRLGVTFEGPHCKAKWVPFNPTSRQQVVQRLVEDHDWEPVDFTETGQPSLDAAVLEGLIERVPAAKDIAELFFLEKLRGQMSTGKKSWISAYNEETGCVHPHTNVGGTVTGRCSHMGPNIGQVPAVIAIKTKEKDGSYNPYFLNDTGSLDPSCFDFDGKLKKEGPLRGRKGEFGWECRSLFRVPPHWLQVGIDLSGIEFRMLAELCAEFDGGELIDVVLNGDIHSYNQEKTGIPTRDIVKRVLYGLLYGAGDAKLGFTAKPTASHHEAVQIGRGLRAALMEGLPALKKAIDKVQREAARGYLVGLDGRRIKIRSQHSALNSRLQSDAALIAKKWLCLIDERSQDMGWYHGWNDGDYLGDYVMLAFIHDESQNAVNPEIARPFAKLAVDAAAEAGKFFGITCPIGAEAKLGRNWAETH